METVHATIVVRPGTALDADAVTAACRERIAGYKVPRSIVFQEELLPKSGPGKILKRVLREPYWEGRERRAAAGFRPSGPGWTNVRTRVRAPPFTLGPMGAPDTVELIAPAGGAALGDGVSAALAGGAVRLVVDLRDAGPLDAACLRALVLGTRTAREREGRLVVLCPAGPARATLRATGLDGHLTIAATRSRAKRAARSAG
jgi:anti-anti-sigma regulatory factor